MNVSETITKVAAFVAFLIVVTFFSFAMVIAVDFMVREVMK